MRKCPLCNSENISDQGSHYLIKEGINNHGLRDLKKSLMVNARSCEDCGFTALFNADIINRQPYAPKKE